MERFTPNFSENRQRLAEHLGWPGNIGIELRTIRAPVGRDALVVWVDGLGCPEVHPALFRELGGGDATGAESTALPQIVPVHGLPEAVRQVLAGGTLLLLDGEPRAFAMPQPHTAPKEQAVGVQSSGAVFGRDLRTNVAQLRDRLRTAALQARLVGDPPHRGGEVALVYVKDQADPRLVRAVRRWASRHAGEEAAALGLMNPMRTLGGLVPRFDHTPWIDRAATLLGEGYVLLLADRVAHAYLAPVTLAASMTAPSDAALGYPARRWLLSARKLAAAAVLLLPGTVIALLNYHQEMIPTAFLLAVGSARENAPLATVFEVFLLELLADLMRTAPMRLPFALSQGMAVLIFTLAVLLAIQTGFVGPVAALAAVVSLLLSLALPGVGLTYAVRTWRYVIVLAAMILGFFGMATVFTIALAYLCKVRSWGIPFLGPSGLHLSSPEARSSHRPMPKGGKHRGKTKAVVR